MKKTLFTFVVMLIASCTFSLLNAQQNNDLRIVRGKADTVFTVQHIITGVAAPGSQIYVNNEEVKQYATGSFGKELTLSQGSNTVKIRAVKDGQEQVAEFSVFYKPVTFKSSPAPKTFFPGRVVVTRPGAYLNYGAGKDRLGGAKINFVDEGIKMELVDSVENLYRVKLSRNRYAYIPKDYAGFAEFGTEPAKSLTGSWSVSAGEKWDVVRIGLDQRLPYTVREELEPSRIILDIFGAECNTNWITQYLDLKSVEYVDLNQIDGDVLRVVIKLKDKYSWGYKVAYNGNNLTVSVKRTPSLNLKDLVIGIDAGHGGPANGAVSTSGIKEKDLNLSMAYVLKEELEKRGARVVLSRSEDVDVTMSQRKETFDKADIDLLVSIHCNAGGNPLNPGGSSTYYKHIEYRELAETILKRIMELDVKNFGLIGNFNFSMNAPTSYPSVLVETLFMSSLPDEEKIANPEFRKELMKRVVKGLEDYLGKVKKSLK
jgi:N-acetylmuramoyl-L-alanine amidase